MTYEGVQVFLTREDGSCPDNGIGSDDVTGRTAYAASVQGDVFISLHNNASGLGYPSSANGACAFVSVHSGYAEESKALAQSILDELNLICRFKKPGSYDTDRLIQGPIS